MVRGKGTRHTRAGGGNCHCAAGRRECLGLCLTGHLPEQQHCCPDPIPPIKSSYLSPTHTSLLQVWVYRTANALYKKKQRVWFPQLAFLLSVVGYKPWAHSPTCFLSLSDERRMRALKGKCFFANVHGSSIPSLLHEMHEKKSILMVGIKHGSGALLWKLLLQKKIPLWAPLSRTLLFKVFNPTASWEWAMVSTILLHLSF